MKKILVAAALPYANGSLHLGHVAALIGADIVARYYRLKGDDVLFVSGSDCHGTPIAVEADRQGVHPSQIADKHHEEFQANLIDGLGFSYDFFTRTTSPVHAQIVQEIFLKLYHDDLIYPRTDKQPYCPNCQRFLADRYVEGECPICHFGNARGDQCDGCGNLLDPIQLVLPRCKICGQQPEWRETEHFFFRLSALQDRLQEWVQNSTGWRQNAKAFTANLLEQGLHDRAITRDTEWGVPIPLPGYPTKRIYVWFEAVIAYLSASREWTLGQNQPDRWQDFWCNDEATHIYVHGKDNIPFHTVIWPAILIAFDSGLRLPDRIYSSEYLTIEKRQFSKSRHWAVWLPEFLREFDAETLRHYLVASGPETSDADFSWSEYRLRTNGELIGNFGNYVHRTASLIKANFPEGVSLPEAQDDRGQALLALAEDCFAIAGQAIEDGHFREGLRAIWRLVAEGNRFLNDSAPWTVIKSDRQKAEQDLAVAAHVVKCLSILVDPYLPRSAKRIRDLIGLPQSSWSYPIPGHLKVGDPQPLYKRIEVADVERQRSKLGKAA